MGIDGRGGRARAHADCAWPLAQPENSVGGKRRGVRRADRPDEVSKLAHGGTFAALSAGEDLWIDQRLLRS